MRRGMEMESEDVEEELEEMSGGLDTPRGAAPETEEGGGGEAEQRSVYYDEDQGLYSLAVSLRVFIPFSIFGSRNQEKWAIMK